jgi:hypothetical protein
VSVYGVYEVSGKRAYRGHAPGETFEARLDRFAERRAIERGAIRLLERVVADLPPDKYRLPLGWPGSQERK